MQNAFCTLKHDTLIGLDRGIPQKNAEINEAQQENCERDHSLTWVLGRAAGRRITCLGWRRVLNISASGRRHRWHFSGHETLKLKVDCPARAGCNVAQVNSSRIG